MPLIKGLQLPFGVQPVNPYPVDSWSGPYTGDPDTLNNAIAAANAAITPEIRFQSMEVRLIVNGSAYKYWYRDGVADTDLVLFSAGAGLTTGSLYPITSSWALNAITSSYAIRSTTSSYAISSSYARRSTTASYALDSGLLDGKTPDSFATTGSNIFVGNQVISGSLNVTNAITASFITASFISASKFFANTASAYKFYSKKSKIDTLSGSGYNFNFGYTTILNAYNFTATTGSFTTLRLYEGNTPSLTAVGAPGEIRIDGDFLYLYTGNNWRRIPANRWFV